MKPPRSILVPTDFSEGSRHALEYAADLAGGLGASLTLVHVVHLPTVSYGDEVYATVVDTLPSLRRSCEAALQRELASVEDRGLEATALLKEGDPAREITEAARAQKADLVVIATQGRRGLARALLGSVTEKVVRLSPVPVLTLHAFGDDAGT